MNTIKDFAKLVEKEQIENIDKKYTYEGCHSYGEVSIVDGRKYTKVNVGDSGKYMVDNEGNIFGIKGYGVVNKKKRYGTLQTTGQYHWGEYAPIKKL